MGWMRPSSVRMRQVHVCNQPHIFCNCKVLKPEVFRGAVRSKNSGTAGVVRAMVVDFQSFSNIGDVGIMHCDYVLDVDFDSKTIEGYSKLHVECYSEDPKALVLDTDKLSVFDAKIIDGDGKSVDTKFEFGEKSVALGTPLAISLPQNLQKGSKVVVGIHFRTSPDSSALQWLPPSQTAEKRHPYLFSQCQAIHARALVPCQDSPSRKMSYNAAVRVPEALRPLMSAVPIDDPSDEADFSMLRKPSGATKTFYFIQKIPIPSYLLAIAVGELVSRDIGPISRVWSEPSMVDAGAFEFSETSNFIEAGKALAGDYVWGVYDLLLLPPSFPYGGMENPCLTFVTPTLLAGDRSLGYVVAHEIAHSWTGNLVTSATWDHFWLNEGFTRFLERKIIGRLEGKPAFDFHAATGFLDLKEAIRAFGDDHKYTKMVIELAGDDPDNSFSAIPYEKGFNFLYYLQELVGGAEVFDPFFKAYIQHFKNQAIVSDDFKSFFLQYFKDNKAAQSIDWDTWFYSTGLPPENVYDTTLAQASQKLANEWHTADILGVGGEGRPGASADEISGWSSLQIAAFLTNLKELRSMKPLHKTITRQMAAAYGFDSVKNSEIRHEWCQLCIGAEDEAILDNVCSFLTEQGRMKFVRPQYRLLAKSKMGKDRAIELFKKHEDSYHPICAKMVKSDLQIE